MAKKITNDECRSYNKIQINLSIDKAANGGILRKSLLLNIRENTVAETSKLYRDLLNEIGENPENSSDIASQVQAQINSNVPNCPKCGGPMVLRLNKKKGSKFWGCVNFPQCKGVRQHQETLSGEQLIPVK